MASGESFNHLVSNGISNLKAVLIIPQLNTLNNNVNLFDTLTTLMFWLVVLMFFTPTQDILTNPLIMNSLMNLV